MPTVPASDLLQQIAATLSSDLVRGLHADAFAWQKEVAASRMVVGKGRTLRFLPSPFDVRDPLDGAFLKFVMGDEVRYVAEANGALGPGRWIGHGFVIEDSAGRIESARALAEQRGGGDPARHLGRFLFSLSYKVTDRGEVFVSPFCAYFMMFNMRIHAFDHRFDQAVADFPAAHLTREHFLTYLLASYGFYERTWDSPERPW